jgi:hypothetical protein
MAAHILSQSHRSSTLVSSGMPGTPAVWFRTWRTVTARLPWAPKEGHSSATGVS